MGTLAAQYFVAPACQSNDESFISSWIAGYMELPPTGIKDEEIVGEYTQVCFVSECHARGVELALSDPSQDGWNSETAQRILLKKGDCFYIPPGNYYRYVSLNVFMTEIF